MHVGAFCLCSASQWLGNLIEQQKSVPHPAIAPEHPGHFAEIILGIPQHEVRVERGRENEVEAVVLKGEAIIRGGHNGSWVVFCAEHVGMNEMKVLVTAIVGCAPL